MKKKQMGIFILFYVAAVFFLLYSIYAGWYSHNYISDLITKKQLTFKGNEFTILSYYMTNTGNYLFYALISFGMGGLLSLKKKMPDIRPAVMEPAILSELLEEGDRDGSMKEVSEVSFDESKNNCQFPGVIQTWLVMNQVPLLRPNLKSANLATICLNLFEEMDKPLQKAGYNLNVSPKEAFSVSVLADENQLSFALCTLLYVLAMRETKGTQLLICAEQKVLHLVGCELTEEEICFYTDRNTDTLQFSDERRALLFAVSYVYAVNGRIRMITNKSGKGIAVELPLVNEDC